MNSSMRLRELHVAGYRSLVDVTLPLRDLVVLIGPNGAGKTALLEALVLLQRASEKQLGKRVEDLGGINSVVSQSGDFTERLSILVKAELVSNSDETQLSYDFDLKPDFVGYHISSELFERVNADNSVWQYIRRSGNQIDVLVGEFNGSPFTAKADRSMTRRLDMHDLNPAELILSQIQPYDSVFSSFLRMLTRIQLFGLPDTSLRSPIRLPQSLIPDRQPGASGENLFSALYNLRTTAAESYERIIETLSLGYAGFQKLEFPVVGAGQVTMTWYQKGLARPLYPNQLSDGMLRFLWLVTILLSNDNPSLILLDEPEISLHPELLKLLAGLLQDAAARCQVIVATQSAELIRWLEPFQVAVVDKDETGSTQIIYVDDLDFDVSQWLKDYTLSDLWLMGSLGGRP